MLEGLYTAAAGMAAQQQRMDALSNDVANINTAGYKHVRMGFRDLVYQADGPSGVRTGSGAAAVQLGRGHEQGALQPDRPAARRRDPGRRLPPGPPRRHRPDRPHPRRLAPASNANGQLVTAEGDQLVPADPASPRRRTRTRCTIGPDGTVTAGNRRLGQIQLVTVPAPTGLAAAGNGYFTVTAASGGVRRRHRRHPHHRARSKPRTSTSPTRWST